LGEEEWKGVEKKGKGKAGNGREKKEGTEGGGVDATWC